MTTVTVLTERRYIVTLSFVTHFVAIVIVTDTIFLRDLGSVLFIFSPQL